MTSATSASKTISVVASIVKSPVASISAIVGVVNVLLVNVSDPVKETKLSPCKAELNSAKEPVKLLPVPPKSYVLFVNVFVDETVTRMLKMIRHLCVDFIKVVVN